MGTKKPDRLNHLRKTWNAKQKAAEAKQKRRRERNLGNSYRERQGKENARGMISLGFKLCDLRYW